jgi:CBS domain-containing protein
MGDKEKKRESGEPGGGAGRKDEVGGSGVYPMSGPHPPGDAPVVPEGAWGQGERGLAGYADSGRSGIYSGGEAPEKCRDVMSKDPVCCVPSDSAVDAARVMKQLDVGPVPVVTDQKSKKLVGIVTDRDLALKVVAEGRDPNRTRLDDIMTQPVAECSPDDDLDQALQVMERRQVRRIPVTDNSGRIVGIIAQADIALRMRESRKTAEMVEEISKPKVMGGGGGA